MKVKKMFMSEYPYHMPSFYGFIPPYYNSLTTVWADNTHEMADTYMWKVLEFYSGKVETQYGSWGRRRWQYLVD